MLRLKLAHLTRPTTSLTERTEAMGFKLLILNPSEQGETAYVDTWPEQLRDAIPDMDVHLSKSVGEAMEVIGEVDAAFGNIAPELFERANNLKWIACPQAGPRAGYYHQALIDSNVVVTNTLCPSHVT